MQLWLSLDGDRQAKSRVNRTGCPPKIFGIKKPIVKPQSHLQILQSSSIYSSIDLAPLWDFPDRSRAEQSQSLTVLAPGHRSEAEKLCGCVLPRPLPWSIAAASCGLDMNCICLFPSKYPDAHHVLQRRLADLENIDRIDLIDDIHTVHSPAGMVERGW